MVPADRCVAGSKRYRCCTGTAGVPTSYSPPEPQACPPPSVCSAPLTHPPTSCTHIAPCWLCRPLPLTLQGIPGGWQCVAAGGAPLLCLPAAQQVGGRTSWMCGCWVAGAMHVVQLLCSLLRPLPPHALHMLTTGTRHLAQYLDLEEAIFAMATCALPAAPCPLLLSSSSRLLSTSSTAPPGLPPCPPHCAGTWTWRRPSMPWVAMPAAVQPAWRLACGLPQTCLLTVHCLRCITPAKRGARRCARLGC